MMEAKKWYQSKALWGSIVTLGATGAGVAGVVISPETQDQLVSTIVLVATGIGGLVSLIGRVLAKHEISK